MAQRTEGHRLLREYQRERGVRQSEIARAVGRRDPTVYAWLAGRSIPDVGSAFALEDFTKGSVPARAWSQRRRKVS